MKTWFRLACGAALGVLVAGCSDDGEQGPSELGTVQQAVCVEQPLARQSATASSIQSASFPAGSAIDGNMGTRWSSAASDPQWLSINLGSKRHISRVVLNWEAAASRSYQLQVSDTGSPTGSWTTIYTNANNIDATPDTITGLSAQGQYLRIYSTARLTQWGNSLWEVVVSGDPNPNCGAASVCGDGSCNGGETCSTCAGDCGVCPQKLALAYISSPTWANIGRLIDSDLTLKATSATRNDNCITYGLGGGTYKLTSARLLEDNAGNARVDTWRMQHKAPGSGSFAETFGSTDTPSAMPAWNTVDFADVAGATEVRVCVTNTTNNSSQSVEAAELEVWGLPVAGCQNNAACSDNNACNGTETCQSGQCQPGTPLNCNDGNACTTDSCNPASGCSNVAITCSDNNACNGTETCQSGQCQPGTPLNCNDGTACTTDSCNPASGCSNVTITCDDNNACTADSCVPASGCSFTNTTAACSDDGSSCTNDVCSGGVCTHPSNGSCSSGCNVPGNLIGNCDFSQGLTGYATGIFFGGAAGTQSVVGGQLQVQITNGGTAAWNVQPRREGLSLAASSLYQASFRARAASPRPLTVSITKNQEPYTSHSLDQVFQLTTQMQTFTFSFTMPATADPNVKFEVRAGFWGGEPPSGQALPTVYLDDLYLGLASPNPNRPSNSTCFAGDAPGGTFAVQEYWPTVNLLEPLDIVQEPAAAGNDFYVVEKHGRVLRLLNNPADSVERVFVNLGTARQLITQQESGMTSLAFHPNYGIAGQPGEHSVYIGYVVDNPGAGAPHLLRLSRFQVAGDSVQTSSEEVLLSIGEEGFIHKAGGLAFGPDGLLYMSVGDDGNNLPGDDNPPRANDPSTPYGKILRLDPDQSAPAAYEMVALGLRNPWRIAFDGTELWMGNVGFDKIEEVNVLDISHSNAADGGLGAHFGWPYCEGNVCCLQGIDCSGLPPQPSTLVFPTYSYPRSTGPSGESAVIGGFVYRGADLPSLYGQYIFADFADQIIYAYDPGTHQASPILSNIGLVDDFGEDQEGELYFVTKGADAAPTGGAYKIVQGQTGPANWPPQDLSDWGCFESLSNDPEPASGVIPYSIAQRFWSDGAEKDRFVAIPDGTVIDVSDPENWGLPTGGVTIKNFYWDGVIFETRLFVRHNNGAYAGYTYEWTGSNVATLVPPGGDSRDLGGHVWEYPSRAQCLTCHTASAGRTLALETRQFNIELFYPDTGLENQLSRFAEMGLLNTSTPAVLSPYPAIDDTSVALATRAESYLHVNCSNCHRGAAQSEAGRAIWDARFTTAFANKGLCDAVPLVAVSGNAAERLVSPGAHDLSTLWLRMHQREILFMPPLASIVPDAEGSALIAQWVDAMGGCPLGRIQAEAYDRASDLSAGNAGPDGACDNGDDVDTEPTGDADGGCNVGWAQAGEWLEYDVVVPATASYDIAVRLASARANKSVRLVIDGTASPPLLAPATGWQSFGDAVYPGRVLSAGNHTVRIQMETGDTNVNYFEFRQLN